VWLEQAGTMDVVFERAFKDLGLPLAIRTDNGTPFASNSAFFGLSKLSLGWLRLGIAIERIKPGDPQQHGQHERMHLTLEVAEKICLVTFMHYDLGFFDHETGCVEYVTGIDRPRMAPRAGFEIDLRCLISNAQSSPRSHRTPSDTSSAEHLICNQVSRVQVTQPAPLLSLWPDQDFCFRRAASLLVYLGYAAMHSISTRALATKPLAPRALRAG
jgi:hypothetical protein